MYLYCLPVIAAFLGWLSNLIFVRYLFGKVLPAQAPVMASRVGKYISDQVMSVDVLAGNLTDPEKLRALKPLIESHIDIFLKEKIKEKMPAVAMFIGEKTMDMMKKSLMEEIDVMLPELIRKYLGNVGDQLNIEKQVMARVRALPEGQIEALLHRNLKREKSMFGLYGAVSGLVIGLILALLVRFLP